MKESRAPPTRAPHWHGPWTGWTKKLLSRQVLALLSRAGERDVTTCEAAMKVGSKVPLSFLEEAGLRPGDCFAENQENCVATESEGSK